MSPNVPDSVTRPRCPICGDQLRLGRHDELDHWACPHAHGFAITLTEAYGQLQDDEISRLWQLARQAPPGPLRSPFGSHLMVRFELSYDDDEHPHGHELAGPSLGTVELDVDLEHQFIWFDEGEFEQLPADLPNEPVSEEILAREAQIREQFGDDLEQALADRTDRERTEQLYRRAARRRGMGTFLTRTDRRSAIR